MPGTSFFPSVWLRTSSEHSKWRSHLQDFGECEVKHGVRVNVANLYTGEVGNPALPEKLTRAKQERDAADEATTAAAGRVVARRQRKVALLAGSFFAILVLGIGFWAFSQRKAATATLAAARIGSLAVKPLDNFSGDATKDYFADGMTDELINKLSQIGALKRVISRSTMMKYKQSPKSAADIAHDLNVGRGGGRLVVPGGRPGTDFGAVDRRGDREKSLDE